MARYTETQVCIIAIGFSMVGAFFAWALGWENGYEQGQDVAHAYYLATNSTPTKEWAYDDENWHTDTVYKVLGSLQKPKKDW